MVRLVRTARNLSHALAVFCLLGRVCYAEDITIRVINTKDGQGVKDVPIWLYYVQGVKAVGQPFMARTGRDGTALFHLPGPLPKRVFINNEISGKVAGCSTANFETREITDHGVVGETGDTKARRWRCDPNDKLKGRFTAKPGEVIMFIRFLKWWERMQT